MGLELGNAVKELVQERKISVLQLAREIDVERTTLQHFFTGKRKIQLDTFQKMMNVLKVTNEKKKDLYVLYEKASNDKELIKNVQDILSLYSASFDHTDLEKKNMTVFEYSIRHDFSDERTQILKGQVEIEALIRSCFIEEMDRKEKAHVIMSVNFRHLFLYELIMRVASGQNQCGIIQNIFPLVNKKKMGNNLDVLKTVLQLKCLDNVEYEPYYFYSGTRIYDDISIVFPNYFITSKYVIVIERDFEGALISREPLVVQYYREKAEAVIKRCERLVDKKDHIDRTGFIPAFEKIAGAGDSTKFYTFDQMQQGTRDGDRRSGKNGQMPLVSWPLDQNNDKSDVFILRDGFCSGYGELGIRYLADQEQVECLILDKNGQNTMTLGINEIGIVSVFKEFSDYLSQSSYVYSPDELGNSLRNSGDAINA